MEIETFQVTDVVLVAVIMALIEVATRAGMPKRFAPVVAIVLGVVGGVVYIAPGDIKTGVIIGIIMALSAVGIYSGTKNTIGK